MRLVRHIPNPDPIGSAACTGRLSIANTPTRHLRRSKCVAPGISIWVYWGRCCEERWATPSKSSSGTTQHIPTACIRTGSYIRRIQKAPTTTTGRAVRTSLTVVYHPARPDTYIWQIPERAGPGPSDPSSVFWLYHSHADELRDVASGLFGVIVVTRRGMALPDGRPKDVDHEFVTMFIAINENESWYLEDNIRDHTTDT